MGDNAEQHARVKALFLAVCEAPAEEREALLEQAGADGPGLQHEVLELLTFFEQSLAAQARVTASIAPPARETPAAIGPYRLLQKLGEGGMGEVFEAEQLQPIRRRVALKLIRWGMDSKEVLARFESERQALALMSHANVARVLDAGVTEDGRPYFAMELVRGLPITDYCDRNRLRPAERLGLFVHVCRGVQHAHQKGIIHRDLKPSNVLVADEDGEPVPKIIDFGIAKAIAQRLTEKTVFTELGQWIGTPEYMSPEQAEMTALDIDTRTDVYSLGVMLYELLVGAQPFDPEALRRSGFDEMRRMIREQEPPRPSTRASGLGAVVTNAAASRGTDPAGLIRQLRGDLDWIAMKALEKDRTRRYSSPSDLAVDIERHLRSEPVLARPPSTLYRCGRFVRRHRLGVGAGSLVALALVAGLALASIGLYRSRRAERLAATQVELLIGMLEALDPGGEGRAANTEEILRRGEERIERELADQPMVRARLGTTMGQIYSSLGALTDARRLLEQALTIREEHLGPDHPSLARNLRNLAWVHNQVNEFPAARQLLERALAIQEQSLGPDHPETAGSRSDLAYFLFRTNQYEAASEEFQRALVARERSYGGDSLEVGETLYLQAVLHRDMGRYREALAGFERALAIAERELGPVHTATGWAADNLGLLLARLGQSEAAMAQLERALEIQEEALGAEHYAVTEPLLGIGHLLLVEGDLEGAKQRFERARMVQEMNLGADHHLLASSLDALGRVARLEADPAQARELFERGLGLREQALGPDHPNVGFSLDNLGRLASSTGDHERALALLQRRLRIVESSFGADGRFAAWARLEIARAQARSGDVEQARRLYHHAVPVATQPEVSAPDRYRLGTLEALIGEKDRALTSLRLALEPGFAPAVMVDDPDLASLRGDPGLEALVAAVRMRLALVDATKPAR